MKRLAPKIETAVDTAAVLGESPVWSRERQRLLWVDTIGKTLHAYDPARATDETRELPDVVGVVAQTPSGALTLALGCDLARLTATGHLERFARAPHAAPGYRLNDGKYDPQGRLWIGLIDEALRPGTGILYRYDPDGHWHPCDDGFTLANGLDWSRDGRTFYITDSVQGNIYAYDFDPRTGHLSNRRVLVHIDPDDGRPDGLTVDAHGFLLSALFDGAAILRIAPNGDLDRKIELPVPRPTSCAFAADGQRLFVTTARIGLAKTALEAAPASGALLQIDYDEALL